MGLRLVLLRGLAALTAMAVLMSVAMAAAPSTRSAPKATAAEKAAKPATKIDLNSATEEQLRELPGIGEAYSKKIIAGRPYHSVKDLAKAGLPAATIEKITSLVIVRAPAEKTAHKTEKQLSKTETPPAKAEKTTTKTGKSATRSETPAKSESAAAKQPPRKGMVWVNTETKIYHKEGSRWYGKTKEGKWMTEEEAKTAGNRPAKE